jgi:hypothetical protein
MDTSERSKRSEQTRQGTAKMFTIVLVQVATPHLTVINLEECEKVDDAMSKVFKLLAVDLTGAHRLCGL